MTEINFSRIEKKWQDKWEKEKVFEINGNSKKEKYYLLEMFPYPSASGLHMGHALNYSIGDVMARFKRMNGFEVFYPMGFDALGLPAENAAIKVGEHPKSFTEKSIKNYIRQMKNLGLSYDWTKTLATMHSEYYRWNQYFFLKFLEAGLIYRKKASVNWCPSCNTVISNEQAQGGICERCKSKIEIRHLEEWYLRTTKYADELLEGLDGLDWSDKIKAMQRNWIGKSHGIEIDFEMENKKEKIILVDAVHCLIDKDGNINLQLKRYLDSLKNKKIILTNAPLEKHDLLFKNVKDYEIFTLENNPNKKDPEYYKKFLEKFNLSHLDVVYFEHDRRNVESAKSVGIKSFFYQNNLEDIKNFINNNLNEKWPIFTTRPDTIFGVTFMVVSAQHEKLMSLVTDGQKKAVEKFLKNLGSVSEKEMIDLEKEGVFTGSYAINPANGEKIPVYAGNFVVADYGSGMIMAVPAHDQRDFGFAKKYKIEVKQVISGNLTKTRAWTGEGELINSGEFNKIDNVTAKKKITSWMIKKKVGRKVVNYKLRDWGFSRQRYWGTPIPIIHCKKCGLVPVPEEDLPVVLPEKVKFGRGNPLTTNEKWINVNCPKCGGAGKRETETMDTFFDSSWYFLRYPDNRNNKKPFDKKKIEKWLPVDQYIGGAEHACMHLIYARFFTKALRDLKFLDFDEPFKALFNQGMLHGPDGEKMSKSKGNIINPDEISKKYGMDSARYFLLSLAAPDKPRNWSEKGIQGSLRF
ncbi:class I tRNA ligase family protein, partial [Candidatus Pacearchaeota archaeon]|nr:class I tRNA ligase family protein [Candidatus Pacearchaeota archaeon]